MIEVVLIDSSKNPLKDMYIAYRNCYSKESIIRVSNDIDSGKITDDDMKRYLSKSLMGNHISPTYQTIFNFAIEHISRSCTAQANRSKVGAEKTEMSGRYVDLRDRTAFVTPPSFKRFNVIDKWAKLQQHMIEFYDICIKQGIPKEDARFGLGLGLESRLSYSFSFEALRKFISERTCYRAQWEIRKVANKMKIQMKKEHPFLAGYLGKACDSCNGGICYESEADYYDCKAAKKCLNIHLIEDKK